MNTIGPLNERIVIQSATVTTDTQGGHAKVWATVATIWAQEIPLKITERLQAQAMGSQVDRRFRIRYRSDITAQQRVSWNGRVLEIHGVTNEGASRQWMLLDVGEVV